MPPHEAEHQEKTIYFGKVHYWNDVKGYGFILLDNGENIFFHVTAFAYKYRRPEIGAKVSIYIELKNRKWIAEKVLLAEHKKAMNDNIYYDAAEIHPLLIQVYIYVLLDIIYFVVLGSLSIPLGVSSLCVSFLTYHIYKQDKSYSIGKHFRIPESTLYIATMLGGWPGALIARQTYRHKINKAHFIVFFWASIIINFIGLYLFIINLLPFSIYI